MLCIHVHPGFAMLILAFAVVSIVDGWINVLFSIMIIPILLDLVEYQYPYLLFVYELQFLSSSSRYDSFVFVVWWDTLISFIDWNNRFGRDIILLFARISLFIHLYLISSIYILYSCSLGVGSTFSLQCETQGIFYESNILHQRLSGYRWCYIG